MSSLIINGPAKLKGNIKVQGAKNSAMKHVFIPLITEDKFTLENIPRIGSIEKHLELMRYFGADISWNGNNTIDIDTTNVNAKKQIPKEFIYYTSGGCLVIPIIASKYGSCTIEIDPQRKDYGGDQIGSRVLKDILKTLEKCGIKHKQKSESQITFSLGSKNPFNFNVPVNSFSASVIALFCALFKNGKSTIINFTKVQEFDDILNFLKRAGASIKQDQNKLFVSGPAKLTGTTYKNMGDPHDLVTWISAGLATNSEITIEGIEYKKMKLEVLEKVLDQMNAKIDLHSTKDLLKPQLNKLKPIKIYSGSYPMFTTEWQVLLSPLFTQIKGESRVVETLFANRMQHWSELAKMGVNFDFYKDPKYHEVQGNPRAVKINGPQRLYGANVNARDVRTGATLIIAAMIAKGTTTINDAEHIDRGYGDIKSRLEKLGVKVSTKSCSDFHI